MSLPSSQGPSGPQEAPLSWDSGEHSAYRPQHHFAHCPCQMGPLRLGWGRLLSLGYTVSYRHLSSISPDTWPPPPEGHSFPWYCSPNGLSSSLVRLNLYKLSYMQVSLGSRWDQASLQPGPCDHHLLGVTLLSVFPTLNLCVWPIEEGRNDTESLPRTVIKHGDFCLGCSFPPLWGKPAAVARGDPGRQWRGL